MKASLEFSVLLPWVQTEYAPLLDIVVYREKVDSLYKWYFKMSDFEQVTKILGKPVEFEDAQIQKVLEYCPGLRENISKAGWKGKSGKTVIEFPKFFRITEFRKYNETGEAKELNHDCPREDVMNAWEIIKKQPKGMPIKSRTVAKNIVENLGITRFNRDTGSFCWEKFFGSRADIHKYFYWPVYVLEAKGAIRYDKTGLVERISDNVEIQTTIKVTTK